MGTSTDVALPSLSYAVVTSVLSNTTSNVPTSPPTTSVSVNESGPDNVYCNIAPAGTCPVCTVYTTVSPLITVGESTVIS